MLRVAAPFGLGAFEPSTRTNGTTAAALDLVYEPLSRHARVQATEGRTVTLELIPAARLTSEQLAQKIRFRSIERVAVVDDRRISVELSTAGDVEFFPRWAGVDVGPFRLDKQDDTSVRLVRRGDSAIDVIEIVEMSSEEETRRLYGRQLDVIPMADHRRRANFEALDSVRILDHPLGSETALMMNVRNAALADVRVRRRIARAIDREALSRIACGGPGCEARPYVPAVAEEVAMPEVLRLFMQEGDSDSEKVGEAIRSQLRRALGVDVVIDAVDLAGSPASRPDAQLTLSPITSSPHRYELFVSPDRNRLFSPTGYANPEYDAAVAAGDLATAQRLLDRDAPITALIIRRKFAVIDARFCGDPELTPASWRWLAELRPCRKGERP